MNTVPQQKVQLSFAQISSNGPVEIGAGHASGGPDGPEAGSILVHRPGVEVQQRHRAWQVGEDGQEPLDHDLVGGEDRRHTIMCLDIVVGGSYDWRLRSR